MAGASDATVRRVLRHKNPRMTEIYQHLSPEWLQTEVNRLRFGLPELLGLTSEPAARRAADPQRISATPERVPENESGTDGFFGMAGRNAAQHQTFEPSSSEGLDIMPLARTERTAAGHELSRRRSRVQVPYSSLRKCPDGGRNFGPSPGAASQSPDSARKGPRKKSADPRLGTPPHDATPPAPELLDADKALAALEGSERIRVFGH